MPEGLGQDQLSRFEGSVEADPGSPVFPALAEAYRRAGRLADAERVLREGLSHKPDCLEGVLLLGLVLLDRGRGDETHRELSQVAAALLSAAVPGPDRQPGEESSLGEISDVELDEAFETAETDRDQVIDADRVASDAMRSVSLELPEEMAPDATFATATVAELLERQGDDGGASRIREGLAEPGSAAEPLSAADAADANERQVRVVGTLERWLANLRGGGR